METIMWLGLAAIVLVLGKFIGKLLWPDAEFNEQEEPDPYWEDTI